MQINAKHVPNPVADVKKMLKARHGTGIAKANENWVNMPRYSKKAGEKVEKVMHEYKEGTLKSGKDGKGGKVKSRQQAIAIAMSEAGISKKKN